MTPTEYCRTELKVPNDSRALGAIRGALEHTARHLGLAAAEEEILISSMEELLRSTLALQIPEAHLLVGIQERADRIEIELRWLGGNAVAWPTTGKLAGIDTVEQEPAAGATRLKLVKFLQSGAKPASRHN